MSDSLKIKKLKVEKLKVEAAKAEMEFKILERMQDIERIESNIGIQDNRINEIMDELKELEENG